MRWLTGLFSREPSTLGAWGEREASRFLKRAGYRIVGTNVRVGIGEADLIAESPQGVLVLVEVKARRTSAGQRRPEAAITSKKAHKLRRLVQAISRERGWQDRAWRIDVVAVVRQDDGSAEIRHHEQAVTG